MFGIDSSKEVSSNAFANQTQITSITLPNTITYIGDGAFSGCVNLTDINIPDGVTYIGERAFFGCSALTNITVPVGVGNIGAGAFSGCDNLNIDISLDNANYLVQDNIVYDISNYFTDYCVLIKQLILFNKEHIITYIIKTAFAFTSERGCQTNTINHFPY